MTEEAKRVVAGLRYCYRHIHCYSIKDGERCPDYDSCQKKVADNVSRNDALADLIESLTARLEQVEMERDGLNIMLAQAQSMLETRTKERDAAVEEMKIIRSCRQCKTWQEYFKDNGDVSPCEDCDMYSNWQWRGVEVEHGI